MVSATRQSRSDSAGPPDVSVVIPVFNDAAWVEPCLRSILGQELDGLTMEVVVVDGLSTDGTPDILNRLATEDGRLRLMNNPRRKVSPALNAGMRAAHGRILVRMDAHAIYDARYVRSSWDTLSTGLADAVGGCQQPLPGAPTQVARAIAALQKSRFGLGGGLHRQAGYQGPASTLWLGAFSREWYRRSGGFDEALYRSEDNDFFQRLRTAGARLHISPAIKASYYCRATVAGLLRQTWATGSEILPTLRRNSRALSSRHLVPGLAVVAAALMLVGIAGLPDEPARWLLHVTAASALAYVTLAVAAAIQLARHSGAATALLSCLLFPLVHFTYGAGTLAGLLKVPGARRRAPLPVVQNRVA